MNRRLNRRLFLKSSAVAGAAFALPTFVPATSMGAAGTVAPSNRITLAMIGVGNQGTNDMKNFLADDRVQVVAVCDANRESPGYWAGNVGGREPAKRLVDKHYKGGNFCDSIEDFREVLSRDDIDCVEVATPDHWHAAITIAAAKAGKDIYCQKPLSLTISDGRAMSDAVKRYKRVLQTGSQQRSDHNFRRACELVRNGRIGKLKTVKVGLPSGTPDYSGGFGVSTEIAPVPDGFNYEMWLGPSPKAPYCPARCHVNFRWILDYSGGQLTDWGGHHPDIAQWGMGTEDTGPVEIKNARGEFNHNHLWNTAKQFYFECVYKNGVTMIISSQSSRGGVTFEGTDGWVWADRGRHEASSEQIYNSAIEADEIHLYDSKNHFRNFIDCVISRQQPIAPVETAHRSITLAHLGNISMKLGRNLKWNPDEEQFVGDDTANRMLARPYRSPWSL